MRYPVLLALALSLCASALAQSQSAKSIQRLDGSSISVVDADAFAKKTLAAAHVTGAQIAVLNNGQPVWSAAYGLRHKDPDLPMDAQTTTWAASITKSVFATYVMQLVERGEFNLDQPIASQLPKPLNQYEPYRETASEIVKDPAWPTVTPRMLLSHSSGLANFAFIEPDKKMHLRFKPGTDFLYSGEGINLVQFVIEQKKGKPIDELLQEAFFTPLGMTRTGIIYRKEFEGDAADRFDSSEKFHAQTRRFPARAAGSMTTSADDLARFASALLDNRIQASTRDAMLSPVFRIHSLHQFPLAPNEGESKEATDVGLAYGVGWGLLTKTSFGPAFFKEGHGDGAQNYMICFERQRSCMIVLTNSDNGELAFRALFETILGDTVTPWEWEGYTPSFIEENRKHP
jgi:CubicO group peptidase (beta-lactamase class C family)